MTRSRACNKGERRTSSSPATRRGYRQGCKPGNAGRRWPAEVLTPEEVEALMLGCSRTSDTGCRNRALIAVLYRSGLRVSEALALYPRDVDHQHGQIRVLHGKGDKSRTVGIDRQALTIVDAWLKRRAGRGLDDTYPLFCALHGTALYAAYVRAMLKRLAADAGIQKRVHPHALRHTMAYELAMARVPMPIIQRQLGHSSLATTSTYLDHIAPADVIGVMHDREWVF